MANVWRMWCCCGLTGAYLEACRHLELAVIYSGRAGATPLPQPHGLRAAAARRHPAADGEH